MNRESLQGKLRVPAMAILGIAALICLTTVNHAISLDARLIRAVSTGDVEAVRSLLKSGANPNARDETGWVEAHVRMTLDGTWHHYARPTAVYLAAESGALEIVRELVKAGADVNLSDEDGVTPLMIADAQTAGFLTRAGANVDACDRWGWTAATRQSQR